jgi:hypothetical protein
MKPARRIERLDARPCLSPEEERALLEHLRREEDEPYDGPVRDEAWIREHLDTLVTEPPRGGKRRTGMSDYDRFLRMACDHHEVIAREAARLLAERRIGQATHDALVCAAGHLTHFAYMAGLSEPEGVTDLHAELRRVGR